MSFMTSMTSYFPYNIAEEICSKACVLFIIQYNICMNITHNKTEKFISLTRHTQNDATQRTERSIQVSANQPA